MNNKRVESIIRDIKSVKIQGARNIARAALKAFSISPTNETKLRLIQARITEPMLLKTLINFEKIGYKRTLAHFDEAQKKINKLVLNLIRNDSIIFTHCHSTNVVNALIYAKKKGKKFQVYTTETRPLMQGRKTARELKKEGIKVTQFIDSAARTALLQARQIRGPDLVFLGADAILAQGAINKIGSGMFSEIAYNNKIPVYIIADSWKYSHVNVPIEERSIAEIWDYAPKNVKIKNPAFEFVPRRFIRAIVSELGILNYSKFLKKVT